MGKQENQVLPGFCPSRRFCKFFIILKSGTSDSRKEWFAVGDYKKLNLSGIYPALLKKNGEKQGLSEIGRRSYVCSGGRTY